jgi:signal transduction histidine kinase
MSVPYAEQKPGESFPLQKLKQQYAILEKMVEDRTAELKTLNEELKTANQTKDKFFSILAHDLKGPFNSLLGFTELLTDEFDDFEKEDIEPIIRAMHKSTNRIYGLTENLLVWSRSQLKSIRFNPQNLNLRDIVTICVDLLHDDAAKKAIEVSNLIDSSINIVGDHYMLSTVFRNLLSNAIKFTPDKGKVRISTDDQNMNRNGRIIVMVDDTGVGIPESLIQDIFLVGKSVSKPGTSNEKGTGLGLAICKEFVNLHDSEIHAENLPAKGCRVWFSLNLVNSQR